MKRRAVGLVLALWLLTATPAWAIHGPGDLYNCDAFNYQEQAQEHMNAHPGDPDRLDGDGDRQACDTLPSRGTAVAQATTTTTRSSTTTTPNPSTFPRTGGFPTGKFAVGAGLLALGAVVFNRGLWTRPVSTGEVWVEERRRR